MTDAWKWQEYTLWGGSDRLPRRRPPGPAGTGGLYCEVEIEVPDLETIVADLLAGQFHDPIRVVAFNTLEHWSQDISREIAAEIQTLCDIGRARVPEHIEDFVHSHTGPIRQHLRHEGAPIRQSNKMLAKRTTIR